MLSAQKQANHGSPYVLKEADIDSYLQDMESRDRRKGTLDNYHRCLEDFLAWLPKGEELLLESLLVPATSSGALYAEHCQHEDGLHQRVSRFFGPVGVSGKSQTLGG